MTILILKVRVVVTGPTMPTIPSCHGRQVLTHPVQTTTDVFLNVRVLTIATIIGKNGSNCLCLLACGGGGRGRVKRHRLIKTFHCKVEEYMIPMYLF